MRIPSRLRYRTPAWRLRTGLLLPILVVVPLFLAVTVLLWEGEARDEAETLVSQRQQTALAGVAAQLNERRNTNETIAYLLSKRDGLGTFIETGNTARLAQTLIVMQAALKVDYISVYASNGARLLHVGSGKDSGVDGHLVARAILGSDGSAVGAAEEGLVVSAATAVGGSMGKAGVLVVGTSVDAEALCHQYAADDVAIFRNGVLVDTSVKRTELLDALRRPMATYEDIEQFNEAASDLHIHAAGVPISAGTMVVALVSTDDLARASQQRLITVGGGTVALVFVLVLIALLQARAIARPLENLVQVAGAMIRGEYRRVGDSYNHEVHMLGRAMNHLADQLERKLTELTHQATHDSLSGLPNRKHFLQSLDDALAQNPGGVGVLFLDLDRFKVVNDSLGHAAGDQLIMAVTSRIQEWAAAMPDLGAILARLGGDEFTILLRGAIDDATVRHAAEQLAAQLALPFQLGGHELVVSSSIGMARYGAGLDRAEDLLRAADVAMYRAKAAGRGTCVMFDSAMGRRAVERLQRETELRQAIEGGELEVHYQPIIDLNTGRTRELEALVRWRHPVRGMISPAEFVPLAEETGLVVPLGRWVLETACQQLVQWHRKVPGLVLNVNLSPRQLQHPELVAEVNDLLDRYNLDPRCLTLEITEGCLMQDGEATQLRALAALGIRIAIDDFGTGYSSLAYLSRLPIDVLKIDRSFVSRLTDEAESEAVVQTIVALGHALDMTVTAEGIETPDQALRLRKLGCTLGQGYLFSRPVEAAAISFDSLVSARAA
jgi:diguanylate cyclase (GGDEF)-like protein